ncbi:MAG: hypothetical protein FJW35_02815 [Acidobacteria bacterium]|nr:hypothetical protein [Acidobacteriota bacterium]
MEWGLEKDFRRAALDYDRAIELNPRFFDAINNLGVCCFELGLTDRTREMFVRTLRIDPDHSGARRNLSILGAVTGK